MPTRTLSGGAVMLTATSLPSTVTVDVALLLVALLSALGSVTKFTKEPGAVETAV